MDTTKIQNSEVMNKFLEKVPCVLCGSSNYSVVHPSQYKDKSIEEITKMYRASGDDLLFDQLVRCKKCSLVFVNPRIKSNLILKGYTEGTDELFVSQAKSRENTFSKSLRLIEKYRPHKGKLLDVGTAGGSFLSAAKKRNWEVYGCEPNKWLADWGNKNYGLKIAKGTILDQDYKSDFFDVVTLWDVIEHTPDPSKVLEECGRIMKRGGLLVVNYPDIGSIVARLMKRKWLFLTSVHLFYFTRKTMKGLLKKNGFKTIYVKPHFQTLEAGYVFFRAGKYNKLISNVGSTFVKSLGLEKKGFPYWLGQTFFLAVKE